MLLVYNIHNSIIGKVSKGMQGVSWITYKEYITIKRTIKYAITWADKAWVKLMQLDTSTVSVIRCHLFLTTTKQWNLVSTNVLVAVLWSIHLFSDWLLYILIAHMHLCARGFVCNL